MDRIHIDAIGGVAGDMFISAFLNCYPELIKELECLSKSLPVKDKIKLFVKNKQNKQMNGTHFSLNINSRGFANYIEIKDMIKNLDISKKVINRALEIFYILATSEAKVHGVKIDRVHFHEVGNWDSIIDILFSSYLIETFSNALWTANPLPLGKGNVLCEHGKIPIPAPATLDLLEDFPVYIDDVFGERVTPTGAAIIKHLNPNFKFDKDSFVFKKYGIGFGTKDFKGISNVLRLFFCENNKINDQKIGFVKFSIDDQSPEDLSIALEKIRSNDFVLDVIQIPAFGKKGRLTTIVEVMCNPEKINDLIELCFLQTTTIGLKWNFVNRAILSRENKVIIKNKKNWNIKKTKRPDGKITSKVESDHFLNSDHKFYERDKIRGKFQENE